MSLTTLQLPHEWFFTRLVRHLEGYFLCGDVAEWCSENSVPYTVDAYYREEVYISPANNTQYHRDYWITVSSEHAVLFKMTWL